MSRVHLIVVLSGTAIALSALLFIAGILSVDMNMDLCGVNGHIGIPPSTDDSCFILVKDYYYRMTHRQVAFEVVVGVVIIALLFAMALRCYVFGINGLQLVLPDVLCFVYVKLYLIDGWVKKTEMQLAALEDNDASLVINLITEIYLVHWAIIAAIGALALLMVMGTFWYIVRTSGQVEHTKDKIQ